MGALLGGGLRGVQRAGGDEEDALVQDLVVFEIVQQGVGHVVEIAGHEDGGAGDAGDA